MKRRLITSYKPKYKRTYARRFYRSVWSSIAFLWILFAILGGLILYIDHIHVRMALADTLQASLISVEHQRDQVEMQKAQIASQNDQLKQKLTDAKLVTADPQTEKIVLYYINQLWGEEAPTAIKVFTCESHLNPATSHVNAPGLGIDEGISQLNSIFQAKRFAKMFPGIPFDIGAHDIHMNLQVAKQLYDEQGWSPWVCARLLNIK